MKRKEQNKKQKPWHDAVAITRANQEREGLGG